MALKTSLVIAGDSSGAVAATEKLTRAVEAVGAAGKRAAPGVEAVDRAQGEATTSAREMATAQAAVATELEELAGQAMRAGAALDGIVGDANKAGAAVLANTDAVKKHSKAVNDNEADMRRHAAGARNLGQQFGDLAVMIGGGIEPVRALATQLGQMGYAASEMGGKIGAVGAFLTGPWGIALTVAVTALAPFVEKLLEGSAASSDLLDKTTKAVSAADSYATAQGYLGKAIDLTTGKLKTHNETLVETIKLQARAGILKAQQDQRDARDALATVGKPGVLEGTGRAAGQIRGIGAVSAIAGFASAASGGTLAGNNPDLSRIARQFSLGKLTQAQAQARIDRLGLGEERAVAEGLKLAALATAREDERANREALTAAKGGGLSTGLRQYQKPKAPKKPKSTEALDEFGRDAATTIAGIVAQFDGTPAIVKQVNAEVARLDDLIEDLGRKKPKNFEKLIADAREAKTVVQAGINKPLDEFLEGQRQQLAQGALILQGRELEAEASARIVAIERQRGPLSEQQKAAVLASVAALRQQERQLERVRAVQQMNLNAVRDIQQIVTQTIYEGPNSLKDLPGRIFESFKRYSAEKITEALFGDIFRDMRDQALGAQKVDVASNTLVSAFGNTAAAATRLAGALANAAEPPAGTPGGRSPDTDDVPSGTEVVVTGRRQSHSEIYGDTIAKVLNKIGIGKDTAATLGKYAGKALAGAFEGQTAAGVAGMLGIKTSNTGAAIGGAIGGMLPIPGGSIIGGLLGGVVGGLFKKSPKGAVSITGEESSSYSGSGKYADALNSNASAVQQSLRQLADTLGGDLGKFSVAIGKNGDWYHVGGDAGADVSAKHPKSPLIYEGKDEGAAIAAAIANAIADGAITGISPKVARALQSSPDIDKALKEALKVQEVETLLGGVLGQYRKAFAEFERTAAERVRIANQYGFDVVAIEKRNAEDRLKLADGLAQAQVGSLKSLVDQLTTGDLFEGSALDKIAALNTAIAKAKTDLDAGVEGAGDLLASLYEQRLAASKTAYGTTSAYAADRNATIGEAQAAIARVNAQIVQAQAAEKASDPALATTNQALDENNDQNARIIAALEANTALLQQLATGGTKSIFDVAAMMAY